MNLYCLQQELMRMNNTYNEIIMQGLWHTDNFIKPQKKHKGGGCAKQTKVGEGGSNLASS